MSILRERDGFPLIMNIDPNGVYVGGLDGHYTKVKDPEEIEKLKNESVFKVEERLVGEGKNETRETEVFFNGKSVDKHIKKTHALYENEGLIDRVHGTDLVGHFYNSYMMSKLQGDELMVVVSDEDEYHNKKNYLLAARFENGELKLREIGPLCSTVSWGDEYIRDEMKGTTGIYIRNYFREVLADPAKGKGHVPETLITAFTGDGSKEIGRLIHSGTPNLIEAMKGRIISYIRNNNEILYGFCAEELGNPKAKAIWDELTAGMDKTQAGKVFTGTMGYTESGLAGEWDDNSKDSGVLRKTPFIDLDKVKDGVKEEDMTR